MCEERDRKGLYAKARAGTGFAPEVGAHVFEPFYTTKPAGEGTGLGLSVAHGVVSDHGGTIRVDSRPDHGTRVEISLPLIENAPDPAD